jgi:hypothetical protein
MKLIAPTKSTIRSATMAAKAISNSSCRFALYAGITFSIAKPYLSEWLNGKHVDVRRGGKRVCVQITKVQG